VLVRIHAIVFSKRATVARHSEALLRCGQMVSSTHPCSMIIRRDRHSYNPRVDDKAV